MDPALAVNLHRALEIGRAQRGQFGVPSTATPLPDQVELRHLDQAIADAVLLQDLTWIDGEAYLGRRQRGCGSWSGDGAGARPVDRARGDPAEAGAAQGLPAQVDRAAHPDRVKAMAKAYQSTKSATLTIRLLAITLSSLICIGQGSLLRQIQS